jgi:hypothetical protein
MPVLVHHESRHVFVVPNSLAHVSLENRWRNAEGTLYRNAELFRLQRHQRVGKPQEELPDALVVEPSKEGHSTWVVKWLFLGAPGDVGKAMAPDVVEARFLQLLNSKAGG